MIDKLLDWVVGREPVATATGLAGGVAALYALLEAFDVLTLTPKQVAAVGALAAWVAGWIARRAVTPVTTPAERKVNRLLGPTENVSDGGVVLFVVLIGLAVVVAAGLFFGACDALFEDPDENNDLGFVPALVSNHDECWDEYDCGGYDERNGGQGDGRGGDGRFGGGRSGDYDGGPGDDCRNLCGNTIIVPTPGERGGQR